jgi:rare lipoprotein A
MRKILWPMTMALVLAVSLAGCSSSKKHSKDPFAGKGSPYYSGKKVPKGGGKYHVGKPYQVAGRWYAPKEQPNYDKKGTASWYGEAFHRRKTANGEWFDMNDLTAAHPTLPIPSYAKVTNLENGKQIIVRINDRGPFVGTRLIDLSKRSSQALGFKHKGKAGVRVQWIGYAPLNDRGEHLAMMNHGLANGASMKQLARAAGQKADAKVQVASLKSDKVEAPHVQQALYDQAPEPVAPTRSGGYIVQVANFVSLDNAQATADALAAYGPTRLMQAESENGTLYRVQVGPMMDKAEATNALYQVRDNGFPDAKLARLVIRQVASN